MLNKNDKIVLVKKMGMFDNVGEVCPVTAVEEDGTIWFTFGGGMHLGCMSKDEFEKYFEVYEEPERMTMDDAYEIIWDSKRMVSTVFDRCTVVACELPSGFVIVESSACIDPEMYDVNIGTDICIRKIAEKILELNAYKTLDEQYEPEVEDDYEDAGYDEDWDEDCDYCAHCSGCADHLSYTGHCDNDADWASRMWKARNEIDKTNEHLYNILDMEDAKHRTEPNPNTYNVNGFGWRF